MKWKLRPRSLHHYDCCETDNSLHEDGSCCDYLWSILVNLEIIKKCISADD